MALTLIEYRLLEYIKYAICIINTKRRGKYVGDDVFR